MRPTRTQVLDRRRAGVLLHPTSLPGPFDFGVLGSDAYRFVDFLCAAGFSVWQTLPLGPVDDTLSPYLMKSAYAGNPRLIDIDLGPEVSWRLSDDALDRCGSWDARRGGLKQTFERFCLAATPAERDEQVSFVRTARHWLRPFALFESLKERFDDRPWWSWPEPLRRRDPQAIRRAQIENIEAIRQIEFEQFLFHRQWDKLRRYARAHGVSLFGDVPIYMAADSVEVWSRTELFQVDSNGKAAHVAGVPPDYFSEDGQLWGNPIYDWDQMRLENFDWWIDRLRHQLAQFDLLRIDHFRALESYWEIPGNATSARSGRWVKGPGAELLQAVSREMPLTAFVAEDLGLITPQVRALRDQWNLPGMLVLQFAFDGSPDNPFLPENHVEHAVVYTGTHDNDTVVGWYDSLGEATRRLVNQRLSIPPHDMPRTLVKAAYASPAKLAIIPMQDLLARGSGHRMNTPGTNQGNWNWRFRWEDVDAGLANEYRHLAESFRRI